MAHHELIDPDAPAPDGISRALPAVAAGGALGSAGRWLVSEVFPTAGGFPWPTLAVNATGALLLGVLMVVVTDVVTDRPLLRLFVGVGILGGWTTFSTYALEALDLLAAGEPALSAAYVVGSVVGGLAAAWLGIVATRGATAWTTS